jgi:hypothetical protein
MSLHSNPYYVERDIVERLRANTEKYPGFENLNTEAAATIETLRAEVKAWRAWRKLVVRYMTAEAPDPSPKIEALKVTMTATDASGALGKEAADGE